ncbi:Antibiotic biosynthesis monooxygenase [Pelagimonas phthalicica]|uniref:Antibiotic biosynthesis monooxygenase n=1 Tax=Pelagimonas phthalicica TaxID=1037362 RepID=A0A238JEB1_9RHOB|nr:putative quinol monooxygenase [Pelagimonas phthalicica]TDS91706.1 antibiotic biosynthesis monooxygenase [Pelagimonas phthalicica]SMX28755.1 Antibiotic biosynthesis monooxygenase [Pelagimonas phthalicica]
MTVTLKGFISVPQERLDSIRNALPEHIRLTRAEPGCMSFVVTESDTTPGRFDVAEEFTDKAAFDAHQARVKASDWGKISAGIERSYEILGI